MKCYIVSTETPQKSPITKKGRKTGSTDADTVETSSVKRYNIERCRSGSSILLLSKRNIDTQKHVNPYVWRRDLYVTQTLDIGLAKGLICLLLKSVGQGEGSSGAQ